MMTHHRTTAAGVFTDPTAAEAAVADLRAAGVPADRIGVLTRGGGVADAATAGAVSGAVAGIALAVVALPVVGPVLAGGLLAGLLAGSVGAAAGGLLGALLGLGIPEEEAAHYERAIHAGHTVITVHSDSHAAEARAILRRHGARTPGDDSLNTHLEVNPLEGPTGPSEPTTRPDLGD